MPFDPKKPFGTIHGYCTVCEGAKYEQGGKFYDTRKNEISQGSKSSDAKIPKAPEVPIPPVINAAALEKKLEHAKEKVKAHPSPSNRGAVTKFENQLSAIVA